MTSKPEVIRKRTLDGIGGFRRTRRDVVPKSASGACAPIRCFPAQGCRSQLAWVSACSRDPSRLSEPRRAQEETEFAQVRRLPDGIAEYSCDASREEPDSRFQHVSQPLSPCARWPSACPAARAGLRSRYRRLHKRGASQQPIAQLIVEGARFFCSRKNLYRRTT